MNPGTGNQRRAAGADGEPAARSGRIYLGTSERDTAMRAACQRRPETKETGDGG